MTFAVSGRQPATTNAERAKDLFEVCEEQDQAAKIAEGYIRAGAIDVVLWKEVARPRLKTFIEWENANCKKAKGNVHEHPLTDDA
jgi:hypothetical protein